MSVPGQQPRDARDGEEALYLYCFADPGKVPPLNGCGVDGKNPLFLWRFMNVGAVLSKVSVEEFRGLSVEDEIKDLSWIAPKVCRHEEVIEGVMACASVFPARFATLFSSFDKVASLIEAHHREISSFLDYARDKEEWAVRGFLNRARGEKYLLAEELGATPPHAGSPGASYLFEKQRRSEIGKKFTAWGREARLSIAKELQAVTTDFRRLKPPQWMRGCDEIVIFNGAFLIPRNALDPFRSLIERINAEQFERGLTLKLTGPWPPYNFCPSIGAR